MTVEVKEPTAAALAMQAMAKARLDGPPRLPLMQQNICEESYHRRRFFFDNPPAGTTEHAVLHPNFWKAIGSWLRRHDVLYVMCEDAAGNRCKNEVSVTVEKTVPQVEVSFRGRHKRQTMTDEVKQLPDGGCIRWATAGVDNVRETGFASFDEKGHKLGSIQGHADIQAAYRQWDIEKPRKPATV